MIDYELLGPADAPRVVLIHGAFVDRNEFDAQLTVLRGFRVLRWDLPEHGRSSGTFRFHDAVDELLRLLDGIGWERAAFVGHSLGGNVAQEVVLRAPRRVRGLFALDCTCNTLPLAPYEYALLACAPSYAGAMPYPTIVEQTILGSGTTQATRAYLRRSLARVPQERYVRIVGEALRALQPRPFYSVPVPLQIVIGRDDLVAGIPAFASRWAARDVGSRFDVIEGAGHCPNIDRPRELNALLARFLGSL